MGLDCAVASQVNNNDGSTTTTTTTQARNEECAICLEAPIKDPVILNACKHAFCSSCMIKWQRQASSLSIFHGKLPEPAKCPFCRTESEEVEKDILQAAVFLAGRANLGKNRPEEEREALRQEAIACLDKALATDEPYMQAYITKAEVLTHLNQPAEALQVLNMIIPENERRLKHPVRALYHQLQAAEADGTLASLDVDKATVDKLIKKHGLPPSHMDRKEYFFVYQLQCEAYQKMQDWDSAGQIYIKMLASEEFFASSIPAQQRMLFQGLARCAYETGKYEKAIATLEPALEMNRSFPGVHKYKALAQKKLGKLDEAIKTMNQAVIYETPWDEDVQAENLSLYRELLSCRGEKSGND